MNSWLVHLMNGLISLVSDNHMDSKLKEILIYVNFGLITQIYSKWVKRRLMSTSNMMYMYML